MLNTCEDNVSHLFDALLSAKTLFYSFIGFVKQPSLFDHDPH